MSDYDNPTLAQRAHADQMLAASRARVDRVIARAQRGDLAIGHVRTVSIGLAVADELGSLGEDEQALEAVAMLAVMIARAAGGGGE